MSDVVSADSDDQDWAFELQERIVASTDGPLKQFDIGIIIAIITALIPMIQNCFLSNSPSDVSRLRNRFGNRALIRLSLRRAGVPWQEAKDKVETLFNVAESATDDELKAFVKYCWR